MKNYATGAAAPTVTIGHTIIPFGLILIAAAVFVVVMAGRGSKGGAIWAVIAIIVGVLLASAFPLLAHDINGFF